VSVAVRTRASDPTLIGFVDGSTFVKPKQYPDFPDNVAFLEIEKKNRAIKKGNLYNNHVNNDDIIFEFKVPSSISEEFRKIAERERARLIRKAQAQSLPNRPLREYVPRKDDIIDYLQSDKGFGPWLQRGLLTRPLIRELSPKAYMALANYLRHSELPDGLSIPTKSETVTAEASALVELDEHAGILGLNADQRRYRRKLLNVDPNESRTDIDHNNEFREVLLRKWNLPRAEADFLACAFTERATFESKRLTVGPLPESPHKYADRKAHKKYAHMNAVEFLREVWGPWIDAGLVYQDDIRRYDLKLLQGVWSHCQRHGLDAKDFVLPRHVRTDRAFSAVPETARRQFVLNKRETAKQAYRQKRDLS
jgi:hypothetical protein